MPVELTIALVAAGSGLAGALLTSVIASRSSESSQLRGEIIELRKIIDRRHTHLSAYARTLEIVLLAWQLPSLPEQIETIRMARESLKEALSGSGHAGGSG